VERLEGRQCWWVTTDDGAASIYLIYEPVFGVIHRITGAQKLGYTDGDGWDVPYYTE
jgi:hypothetical protein